MFFCTEESDSDDEMSKSGVPNGFPSEDVGEQDRDAVGTIQEEITEMNTMDFDKTHVLHQLVGMWHKTD